MKSLKTDLSSMAMTVQVESRCFTGRKRGKKEIAELARLYGCKPEAMKVSRYTIPEDIVGGPIAVAVEAYQLRDYMSSRWSKGVGIIRAEEIEVFQTKMNEVEAKFWKAVDRAVEKYEIFFDGLYENGPERMGKAFDESDYPLPSAFRAKYIFRVHYGNLADSTDWRVNLPSEKLAELAVAAAERERDIIQNSIQDSWSRLYEVVSHLAERINYGPDDKKKIFRDTLVGNVAKLCEVLPLLNISGDPELDKIGREIYDKLGTSDPAQLRDDPVYRGRVKTEADKILEKIGDYI